MSRYWIRKDNEYYEGTPEELAKIVKTTPQTIRNMATKTYRIHKWKVGKYHTLYTAYKVDHIVGKFGCAPNHVLADFKVICSSTNFKKLAYELGYEPSALHRQFNRQQPTYNGLYLVKDMTKVKVNE